MHFAKCNTLFSDSLRLVRTSSFAMVLLVAYPLASASDYVFKRGDKRSCEPFRVQTERIVYLMPTLAKNDPAWKQEMERCPNMFRREKWMPHPNRDFDDFSLYKIDINNDGQIDNVLYRRYDKPHFVAYVKDGVEHRRESGVEIAQEFFIADFGTCKLDKVFGGFAETRLFQLDNAIYIENVNIHDRYKTKTIYKKSKLNQQEQQPLCVFTLTH